MIKKLSIIFAVLLIFGLVNQSTAQIIWPVNGHIYQLIVGNQISWADARAGAQSLGPGWDLATITSASEQTFINNNLLPSPSGPRVQYWIGGFQNPTTSLPAANWFWVTGEVWGYTNWGEGQPDDWSGDPAGTQYYLALDSDQNSWGWDDNTAYPNLIKGYLAENPIPEPGTILLLGSGFLGLGLVSYFRRKRA